MSEIIPLQIAVDSREQKPYLFEREVSEGIVSVTRAALPAGDYSLVGYETRISIERKSLEDLVQTVIKDRARFAREMQKLDLYQDIALVVEASMEDITKMRYRSRAHWASVLGACFSIQSQFRCPIIFCGDRAHAALAVRLMLSAFARKVEK